jgi:hypothetical protein
VPRAEGDSSCSEQDIRSSEYIIVSRVITQMLAAERCTRKSLALSPVKF